MLRNGLSTVALASASCLLVVLSASPAWADGSTHQHDSGRSTPGYQDDSTPPDGSSAQNGGSTRSGVAAPGIPGYSPTAQGPTPPATKLTITIAGSPVAGHDGRFVLTCDPAGGQHPDPKNACAKLDQAAAARQDLFAGVPEGQMCAQVFGGPATAEVVGTWRDRTINTKITRTDGCQTDRWNKLVPVIPPEAPTGT
ncbi:SSI family serine proteinase inhibitor [Pseudonocardia spinosispora]|uniref:SSI family serine proteinase inhibitor n=1 Tax=Pseudonocardia spinosispora TaxID=103441 RepID=UPI000428594D|nr:SSI family serine proteinase inhibitor [Pseudonocardia spinosispora]